MLSEQKARVIYSHKYNFNKILIKSLTLIFKTLLFLISLYIMYNN